MSQNNFLPSTAFDQYDGATKRTKKLEEELKELEDARDKVINGEEEKEESPDKEFEEAYSEVKVIASDAKAAAENTRWAQKRFNEKKEAEAKLAKAEEELREVKRKLEDATRRKPSVDIKEWAQENPESAAQVDARIYENNIAQSEKLKALEDKIAKLEQEKLEEEEQRVAQAASQALVNRVPDAMEIMRSDDFNEWLEQRPAFKQIIEGTFDVDSAEDVLKNYKFSKVASTPEKLKKKTEQAEIETAAESIKSSSNQPIDKKEAKIWKASEIAAMSVTEYQKHQEEIDDAWANGRFDPNS